MWTLKLTAALAVILSGAALGAGQAARLCRRRMALQDALLLLRLVGVRMENSRSLWMEELAHVAQEAAFQVLCFPPLSPLRSSQQTQAGALDEWLAGAGVPALLGQPAAGWLQCALEAALTRQETAARLDYYAQLLQQALEAALEKESRDRRLCCQLGWIGGALVALILW